MSWSLYNASTKPLNLEAQLHGRKVGSGAEIHSSDHTLSDECALAKNNLAQDQAIPRSPTGPLSMGPQGNARLPPPAFSCLVFLRQHFVRFGTFWPVPSLPGRNVSQSGRIWLKDQTWDVPIPLEEQSLVSLLMDV